MTTQQISLTALQLPLPERIRLAQELWQSVEGIVREEPEDALLQDLQARLQEIRGGTVPGRSHAQVMQSARNALA